MTNNKQINTKELVKIRFKKLANGSLSIYLDIYNNGIRSYEFLHLYLMPETTPNAKIINRHVLSAANAIKARRMIDLINGKASISHNGTLARMRLSQYVQHHIERSRKTHRGVSYAGTCSNMYNHLVNYLGPRANKLKMRDIDIGLCQGFAEYLKHARTRNGKRLSGVSAYHYFCSFKSMLAEATIEQAILTNPIMYMRRCDMPQRPLVIKDYLHVNEVMRLANTPCLYQVVKQAFLFSCFTGLRLGDIRNIRWSDIRKVGDDYRYSIIMQKTQEPITNKVNADAIRWLPALKGRPNQHIFSLPATATIEKTLAQWAQRAQINKHVTFHTARHSYATMALMAGADLYTISKLLGHRNIKSTTIYAAVIDSQRDTATDNLSRLYQEWKESHSAPRSK